MNLLGAWNRFWFGPISARPLGLYRIVYGILVLVHLGLVSVDLDHWYTDAGLLQGDEARVVAGPLRLSPLLWVQDPVSVRCFLAGLTVVTLAFLVGWRTRVMSILLYLGLISFHHRNIATNCGPDLMIMITSFFMMLSPCGAAYSLDARRGARRRGTDSEPIILPWAQRLMQIQICLVYFDTAFLKSRGTTWADGTAIHYVLFNHEVGQFNLEWLARYPLALAAMTNTALWIEFSLAFLLWFRPTRRWIALAGLTLHAGIVPLVNAPLFGEQMTAVYLLFLAPDELDALLRWLDPRNWFRTTPPPSLLSTHRIDSPSGLKRWHQLELAFTDASGE